MVQLTSALLLLSAATSAFATQCFYPAGNPASGNVPCDENAEVSPCCASKDRCLSNGLCRVNDDPSTTEYARGSCTDEEWGPGCFPQCLISHPGSPVTNGAAVFMCNSTGWTDPKGASYCCEKDILQKTGCCSGDTFWLPPGGVALPITTSAPAPAPSSTSSEAAAAPSVTTVDSFTTTTASCTTSTVPSVSLPAQQNTTSTETTSNTDVVVSSSTTSAAVSTDVVSTGTVVVPTNGTITPVSPSQPVATGAASKYQVAGVAGLVGAFAFALL